MRTHRLSKILSILSALFLLGTVSTSAETNNTPTEAHAVRWHVPFFRYHNVWQDLAHHFTFKKDIARPETQHYIRWFQRRQDYINELTRNASPYVYYIYQETKSRGMPAELALLPMIESNYNPFRYSFAGATGLWQMMPGTASGFGLKINWWYDGRRNIITSTSAALDYLTYLHSYFGNWLLAIAAYDSGEGTVQAAIRYNLRHHRPTDFWHLPLPRETKAYVPKLLALVEIVSNAQRYNLHLVPVADIPYFAAITINKQINLTRIAKLAATDIAEIRKLNPGFRRFSTAPKQNYELLLPVENMVLFEKHYATENGTNITWEHHVVKNGESLSGIAQRNHTNITIIKRANHLKDNTVRVGQVLLIPKFYRGKSIATIHAQRGSIAEDRIPGPKRLLHTVRQHDSLVRIAREFGVKVSQLRYWNKLGYPAKLTPGQKLVIWKKHRLHPRHRRTRGRSHRVE